MRNWLIRVALLSLAVLSLSTVARNALVQTANDSGRTLPLVLRPDDAVQVLLRNGLLQVDLLKSDISKVRVSAATKAATRLDALDFRPFLIAGLEARKTEQLRPAAALLTAARQRQPRNFNIRRLLMEVYLIDGRYDEAAREILTSTQLKTSDVKPLMQALALFDGDPSARQALMKILGGRGDWRVKFTTNLDVVKLAPDLVLEVANNPAISAAERLSIVKALAQAGQIESAYTLWTQSTRNPALRKGVFPTDPGFDGWAQSSGFGWKFSPSGDGVAELINDSSGKGRVLDVEFFGGSAVTLVEQPMLLTPGTYVLSIAGNHMDGQSGAGDYRWTLQCAGVAEPFAAMRIPSAPPSKFAQSGIFEVPAENCPVQMLKMMILPGEMSISMRSTFSNVGISRQ